ncbi:hypothetical protein [Methylobacterium flocculans]|uniref:hypothetical protein n=1 Tax=Methylobacterium flocculans TaxID=2984843 RepID=UPI0021F25A97|nr:hypothetical protein [Methylobacterium sp. FF17]
MLFEEMAEAIGRAHGSALDEVSRALWASVAIGQVSDEGAALLSAAIEARRPLRGPISGPKPVGAITLRLKPQRCPDRAKALERTRRWAAAGRMPPNIAMKFTLGEQAALAVIAFEISRRQFCDKSIGDIGCVAGVSESTVKRAVRQAKALGFLTVQERRLSRYRNDTNIVRIISKAWLAWIDLRGARGGVQPRPGTNTSDLKPGAKADLRISKRAIKTQGHLRLHKGHQRPLRCKHKRTTGQPVSGAISG